MEYELSDFGKRFADKIGIAELMDDLGSALSADPAPLMLGGGNPAHVPEIQEIIRQRMVEFLINQANLKDWSETMILLKDPLFSLMS